MEKISSYQLILMGGVIVTVVTLVNTPSQASFFAKQHIYLPYILSAAFISLFLWLMSKVTARFPKQNFQDVISNNIPIVGRIISTLYIIFFIIILARDLRILTDFINVFLLPETPLFIVSFLFVIPIVFMVRGGIEILGRMTELFMPILIIVLLSIPVMMIKDVNVTFFQPLLDFHWTGIGIGWWYVLPYMGEIMLLPFLLSNRTFKFKHGLYGLGLGTGLLLILILFELLILGIHLIPRMMYPTYILVRQINITDFLDRFEILLVALYFPSTILKMSYFLYLICDGFHKIIPRVSPKLIAAPFGLLGMVLSHWLYEDLIQLVHLNVVWTAIALVFEFLIPLLLFCFLFPKAQPLNNSG